ncbi:YsnF/AvaK domain-containing protein [Leptolyngbya sp. FACHB-321]|uniref:YsnF/AvaK domain-containing protein n=1 Tax=Leptolyngbya sp. FACHB-321 TaxID=2692807 RepID=UPI001685A8F8|nr:YsnF/AvaK domain-containing protein [Leptolyngbya sp. FACHB-321]MBD2033710.1 YsnF/AvaK domain-containing protein [Leptolyngbya sp. FACHB-321]
MVVDRSKSVVNRGHRRAIGTFPTRRAAEQALHELRDSGFPMDRVSVVAQDGDRKGSIAGASKSEHGDNKADDGAKAGALSGGALGGLTGLLVGLGALAIPGLGPIMLAGAAATALATTAAGTAIGAAAGTLLGGLIGMGIPEDRAKVYNDRVSAGEYLVMVDGTDAEIAHAQGILNHRGVQEWGVYDIPATAGVTTAGMVENQPVHQPTVRTDAEAVRKFEERRIKAREDEANHMATPVIPTPVASSAASQQVAAQPISTAGQTVGTLGAENIELHEERLIVDKKRAKTGEVAIGKHIETEVARTSIPIEKERVVIERSPGSIETGVTLDANAFQGETARIEVYEETPVIHKEAFVREEVSIRKEVDHNTVNVEESLRREEINVDVQGHPAVDARPSDLPKDRR